MSSPEPGVQRSWYCPACGGRLSYGLYCKECQVETEFQFRPATDADRLRESLRSSRATSPALDDPWAMILPADATQPGSIRPQQQIAIHAACTGMERDQRLATISDIIGRAVTSSNELSYTEAARVLGKLAAP